MRSLPTALLFGALAASALGCSESEPTRVWRPEDHAHPAGSVDPSRMTAPAPTEEVGTARERAIIALYQVHCASCHGANGRGDGPGLEPGSQPPDFTSAEWQGTRPDEELARSIAQGKNAMPAFGDRVADENIAGLVALVRAFAAPAAPAAQDGSAAPAGPTEAPAAP